MRQEIKHRFKLAVIGLVLWLALGTIMFHFLEDWTWITAFYFSVSTLTTVGYGDFYPTTDLSRLFTSFFILLGVGVVLATLGMIGSRYLQFRESKIISKEVEIKEEKKKIRSRKRK